MMAQEESNRMELNDTAAVAAYEGIPISLVNESVNREHWKKAKIEHYERIAKFTMCIFVFLWITITSFGLFYPGDVSLDWIYSPSPSVESVASAQLVKATVPKHSEQAQKYSLRR